MIFVFFFLLTAIAEQIQRNFMAQTMSEEELKVHMYMYFLQWL